ncbi:MAG: hypothetical protein K8F27_02505, partial [Sulfuricellaceae bacterium]|nr:hypothetical protein [Sulfuricellaceae bacterium]
TINRVPTLSSAFVESGVVTLQFSSFAASGGQFAATTSVYGGETAEVANSGGLNRIRIGSLLGDKKLPGDPLSLTAITTDTTVPKLDGNLARLGSTASLITVIQDALNAQFGITTGVASYDSSTGIVTFSANGKVYRFIPIGTPTVQVAGTVASTRSNRFSSTNPASTASGAFSLASRGIQLSLASSLAYFTDLKQALVAVDPSATIRLLSSGALKIYVNGLDVIAAPGSNAAGGGTLATPGFQLDSNGYFAFKDSTGAVQSLYPVFADVTVPDSTVKALDPAGSVSHNGNGTATLVLSGNPYTIKLDYFLVALPAAHAADLFWLDGAKIYIRYPDNTAQAFTL